MYYPDQNVPIAGACGLDLCGGYMDGPEELPADSDFERFFGVVDTCSDAAAGGDEVCVLQACANACCGRGAPYLLFLPCKGGHLKSSIPHP